MNCITSVRLNDIFPGFHGYIGAILQADRHIAIASGLPILFGVGSVSTVGTLDKFKPYFFIDMSCFIQQFRGM